MCSDSWQRELLRDGRDNGNGTIGRYGEHSVDALTERNLDDLGHGHEVDDLGDVGRGEARRVRVAVDSGNAQPARACLLDGTALMASRADEEDRCHRGRC